MAPQLYSDVKKYVSEGDVFYCPNGVPKGVTVETIERKNNEVTQLLFLSNLIESKGVYTLLGACSLLKSKKIAFRCIFIGGEGDITADEFREKVVEMFLDDAVFYEGKKYDEDKDEAYRNADIFALPTYYDNECFPLVLLEAMQYGLPIVSTPEGAIEGIIREGQNGFLVQQRNMEELADRLELLILNPNLRFKMGSNGRKSYLNDFTLKKFEENLLNVLKSIV